MTDTVNIFSFNARGLGDMKKIVYNSPLAKNKGLWDISLTRMPLHHCIRI